MSAIKNVSGNVVSAVEIMQFMTHNSLLLYKKKGSRVSHDRVIAYEAKEKHNPYRKGWSLFHHLKMILLKERDMSSLPMKRFTKKDTSLSHWTPNTFRGGTYYNFQKRIIKGHTRDNLKQINVIGFDIDTKEVDLYALYLGCEELGLPRPNLLLETPRGFQFFLFWIHHFLYIKIKITSL